MRRSGDVVGEAGTTSLSAEVAGVVSDAAPSSTRTATGDRDARGSGVGIEEDAAD